MLAYAPWLCWVLPVIGALLAPLFGKVHPKLRDYAAVIMVFLGAVFAFSMIIDIWNGTAFLGTHWLEDSYLWLQIPGIPGFSLEFGMLIDPLSVFMACIASGVGFLIMVFSIGYMKGDDSLTRYWFFMQFFIGGMVLLVMANNLLMTFIGWEIVGLCSYALIGFWYNKKNKIEDDQLGELTEGAYNSHCGMKAFIVTRIGDVGLLISIIFVFFFTSAAGAPTFNYQTLLADFTWLGSMALVLNGGLLFLVLFLFFLGPIGKSAQFPLQIWLPEAMAGPTTVSALIHAAAMVKAGVYLVARMMPILVTGYLEFMGTSGPTQVIISNVMPNFFLVVAGIGAFTALMAATMAIATGELKKVLAFSTISQLGYMFLGLGIFALGAHDAEGFIAATFHLSAHAVFKALLFLSAGAVLHTVHSKNMFDMGGLRKAMPITYICMLAGALSLGGVPPFVGFWSKELIFASAWHLATTASTSLIGLLLLSAAAITGAMTFFYTLRMIGLVFHGPQSRNVQDLEKKHKLHEAPKVMWIPLAILAVTTLVLGFLYPFIYMYFFGQWGTVYSHISLPMNLASLPVMYGVWLTHTFTSTTYLISPSFLITIGVLLLGGIPGYFFYIRRSWDASRFSNNALHRFLYNRWYYNRALYFIFVRTGIELSEGMYKHIEEGGIDRFNYAVAEGFQDLSRAFRKLQTGVHSWNMILLLIGALALILLLLFGGTFLVFFLP